MRSERIYGAAALLSALLLVSNADAQTGGTDVYWHIDPSVKDCSMVIDPSLTQSQWHTFVSQTAAIMSFKALSSATTLGRGRIRFGMDFASTPVDQHDLAWINTFTHPDADCPLGDQVELPTLRFGVGVTDRMDVGGYWITNPEANYGMAGVEAKYAIRPGSENAPAVAARGSITILTGVPDYDMSLYSAEIMASRKVSIFTPYLGFKQSLVVGTETTSKVDLDREILPIEQGYAGVAVDVWHIRLAAEYNLSTVNTFAFAVGLGF